MDINRFPEYVEQLIDGIDRGDFSDPELIPDTYTYEHLYALFFSAGMLDGGVELFCQMHRLSDACTIAHLQKKSAGGEKIRAVFVTPFATTWQAESVYRSLEADARFEVYVMPVAMYGRTYEARRRQYEETLEFFQNGVYHVIDTYHAEQDASIGWKGLGWEPDIVISLNAYVDAFPPTLDVFSLPLRCMQIYLPYCIYTPENKEHTYMDEAVFFRPLTNIVYRMYVASEWLAQECKSRMILGGENVMFTGFPKMDYFYEKKDSFSEEAIRRMWKIPDGGDVNDIRRVIIAPHHSMMPEDSIKFSTFPQNAFFLLYLAEKYRDRISFIYKPHPVLRKSAVESGFFNSFEEYDAYAEKWNRLPNARVVTEDSYLDIFATSDAMIMDCCSFLGEYLYADKPCLYLTGDEQRFNGLGEKLMSAYYTVEGTDYTAIETFLEDVVSDGKDTKADTRNRVFREELDYVAKRGMTAGETIYRDIVSVLESDA